MQIGLLVTNRQQLAESADWDFDYLEGSPGLLGIDADDPRATEREFSALLAKHPLQMKTMCGFIGDPQGRGLMVVGPDVSLDRLRTFVTRVFDLMQRAGVEVIGYGSGGSRWVPDGFDRDKARQQVADFMHLCADLGEPTGSQGRARTLQPRRCQPAQHRLRSDRIHSGRQPLSCKADGRLLPHEAQRRVLRRTQTSRAAPDPRPHCRAWAAADRKPRQSDHALFLTHLARIWLRRARNTERCAASLCRRRRDCHRPQEGHRVKVPSFAYSRMIDLSRTIAPSEGRLIHYRHGARTR